MLPSPIMLSSTQTNPTVNETPPSTQSPTPPAVSPESFCNWLAPLPQSQLIQLLAQLGSKYPIIGEEIRDHVRRDPHWRKLFVRQLSFDTTTETLERVFAEYGEIAEAAVIFDKATQRSKGFGFVTFADSESAERALLEPFKVIDNRMTESCLASLGKEMHISQQQIRSQNPNMVNLQGPNFVQPIRSSDSSPSAQTSHQGSNSISHGRTSSSSSSYSSVHQHRVSQPHVSLSRQSFQSVVPFHNYYIPHSQQPQYNPSVEYVGDSSQALPNASFVNPQEFENLSSRAFNNFVHQAMLNPNPNHTNYSSQIHPNQNQNYPNQNQPNQNQNYPNQNQPNQNQNHPNQNLNYPNQNLPNLNHHSAHVSPHQMYGKPPQVLRNGSSNQIQNTQFQNNMMQHPCHQNQSYNNSYAPQPKKSSSPIELNDAITALNITGNNNKLSKPPSQIRYDQYGVPLQ